MIQPYLMFNGNCKAALDFYKQVFDTTENILQSYNDYIPAGVVDPPADLKDWILHAELDICGTACWFADEIADPVIQGNQIALTLTVPDAKTGQRIFDGLNDAAKVNLPPTQTFYSTFHAAIVDKFNINWNIVALEAPETAK